MIFNLSGNQLDSRFVANKGTPGEHGTACASPQPRTDRRKLAAYKISKELDYLEKDRNPTRRRKGQHAGEQDRAGNITRTVCRSSEHALS